MDEVIEILMGLERSPDNYLLMDYEPSTDAIEHINSVSVMFKNCKVKRLNWIMRKLCGKPFLVTAENNSIWK